MIESMEQYIPKDAVVAEIERLQAAIKATAIDDRISKEQAEAYKICVKLRSFVEDTLEVKEVDLEKEIKDVCHGYRITDFCESSLGKNDIRNIAKHFFELGLRSTITEKDCKLIWNIGDDLPYMSEEEFFKELLRRYKAQKGEKV